MRSKKYIACMLATAMVFSMAGCSSKKTDTKKETSKSGENETEGDGSKDAVILKDGDVMVDIDFDDGETDGFVTYVNGGNEEMTNEDNKLAVKIKSCGSKDYANQVYWDGFILNKGAVYTYSFDISSDIERKVEYRLQINGGDFHAYQGEYIDVGPETLNFSVDFTMEEDSDPAPRIVFNMGYMEDMTEDPGEHTVYIDNIKLTVKDSSNAQVLDGIPSYNKVVTNEIGYMPNDSKRVVCVSREAENFEIINEDSGELVYEGKLTEKQYDKGTQTWVQVGDFSDFTDLGSYHIKSDAGESYQFEISEDPYADIYKDTVLMLYRQRCGIAIEGDTAGFDHPACHLGDDGLARIYDTDDFIDVTGGWHDAGDYGRYVVSGAKTVEDLLIAYEDYNITDDEIGIPESGNGVPDFLDEARFEIEWMLKMQDKESGGVYHKVTCLTFPETVMPEDETDELIVSPMSDTATADFAAVCAKAAGIYNEYDESFADTCKEAALKAWDYLMAKETYSGYKNPKDIVTGEYPDTILDDEVMWAAVCLNKYAGQEIEIAPLMTDRVKMVLGWANMGGYAYYELANSDLADSESAKKVLTDYCDELKVKSDDDMYKVTLERNYVWGSNMNIANAGELFYMAYNLTGNEDYKTCAKYQLDYLLGANSMAICFVTGYGEYTPQKPHHRPSQALGKCMPGMLVGGANASLDDPYAKAVLYDQVEPRRYADNEQSYSTNEVTIYWNSPLIYDLCSARMIGK